MILDAQSARAATGVPAVTTGKDPAKRVPCPERGLAADVLSLVITVVLVASSVHDNAAGTALLDPVAVAAGDSVSKALVDQGFEDRSSRTGQPSASTSRSSGATLKSRDSFRTRNGGVEQTFGTLILHRRLVRDY